MSLQSSTHSSQTYTEGPAMSFLTSCWLFPQKEQYSNFPLSPLPLFSPITLPLFAVKLLLGSFQYNFFEHSSEERKNQSRFVITESTNPYSAASVALIKLTRSVSRSITSRDWPVCSASIVFSLFLIPKIS